MNPTDEYMTPPSAWEAIQKYIPKNKVIWEAFYGDGKSGDTLRTLGFKVIHDKVDFFENNLGVNHSEKDRFFRFQGAWLSALLEPRLFAYQLGEAKEILFQLAYSRARLKTLPIPIVFSSARGGEARHLLNKF